MLRARPPQLDLTQVQRRVPLWRALADLYLDNWSENDVPHILHCAREGGFTLAEVDHILRWEVRPALYPNYLSTTGEWAGWPEEWLVPHILEQMAKRPSLLIGKNRFIPEEWPQIEAAMLASETG